MEHGDIRKAIIAEIERDPNRSAKEIGAATGATAHYVAQIARMNGLKYRAPRPGSTWAMRGITEENWQWLRDEARETKTHIGEFLNAIITDARLEDQE